MDLDLTDDQELLRDTAAKFIKETYPVTAIRALSESPTGVPDGYLAQTAELGWFAMLVPEELGGGSVSGDGLRDLAIVAEARGRGLQPGPFVPMNVVAAALARSGSEEQRAGALQSIVAGASMATWAATDSAGFWNPEGGVTATPSGDGFVLSGEAGVVQDAESADWILVTAGGPSGITQFLVPASSPGVTILARESHDVTQRFSAVHFDAATVPASAVVGAVGTAADDVEHQLKIAVVLSLAEAMGAMDTLFEMARVYAIDRIAFGRPIGSFQAVKHQLADLSLLVESGKAITAAATQAVQAGLPESAEVSSMAKAFIGDAAVDVAQGCFQIFAGIGFTWEHDSHLYLRRLTMGSLLYGSPDWHRERICVLHGI